MRICWLLILVGCTSNETLFVGTPDLSDARAALIAVVKGSDVDRVLATEVPSDGFVVRLDDALDSEPTTLYLIGLDQPLAHYDLLPGSLQPASSDPSRLLPREALILHSIVTADGAAPWQPASELPIALRTFRIKATTQCPTYDIQHVELPTSSDVGVGLAVDERTIFFMTGRAQRFFMADEERFWEVGSPITSSATISAVATSTTKEIWFADRSGGLWHGQLLPTPTFEAVPRFLPSVDQIQIDLSRSGTFELLSLSGWGTFSRFDFQNGWEVLDQTGVEAWSGGVVWLGPQRYLAVDKRSRSIRHVIDGRIIGEELGEEGFSAAAYIPDFGTVLGTVDGRFYYGSRGTWTPITEEVAGRAILSIVPYGQGFAAGGENLMFVTYAEGTLCLSPIAPGPVSKVIVLKNGAIALLQELGNNPSTYLTWLRPL